MRSSTRCSHAGAEPNRQRLTIRFVLPCTATQFEPWYTCSPNTLYRTDNFSKHAEDNTQPDSVLTSRSLETTSSRPLQVCFSLFAEVTVLTHPLHHTAAPADEHGEEALRVVSGLLALGSKAADRRIARPIARRQALHGAGSPQRIQPRANAGDEQVYSDTDMTIARLLNVLYAMPIVDDASSPLFRFVAYP